MEIEIGSSVRAIWDYSPKSEQELCLEQDDVLVVTKMDDDGWWTGELNGNIGLFPYNYVTLAETESKVEAPTASALSSIAFGSLGGGGGGADIDVDDNRAWFKNYKSRNPQRYARKEETEISVATDRSSSQVVSGPTPVVTVPSPAPQASEEGHDQGGVGTPMPAAAGMLPTATRWIDVVDPKEREKLSKDECKRQEVLYELFQTESDYVRDMDVIVEVFMIPCRQKKVLKPKDLSVVFSNIEQLLPVNQELLRLLAEQRTKSEVVDKVGHILLRLADYLKMYNVYCRYTFSFSSLSFSLFLSLPEASFSLSLSLSTPKGLKWLTPAEK
eukprot:Lithocolla_globosa_v1_NODE_1328_length_2667_cov_11.503446.p2 type:complete len:329 gc:universal NODE_1328_length_2667_cov_11.503446:1042-56(-)